MTRLEDLPPGAIVQGILPNTAATILNVLWDGADVVVLTHVEPHGAIGHTRLERDREPDLVIASAGLPLPDVSRFTGALLGGAIGDALGRPAEGLSPAQLHARYGRLTGYKKWHGWQDGPIGTVTDDTQLTMCVASCLTTHGYLDTDDLVRRFISWLPEGRGKGRATVAAVKRLMSGVPWYLAGDESLGNGAAMRASPVGLAFWHDHERLRANAVLSALPTHRGPMAVAGAVAMAAATAFLASRQPGSWTTDQFISAVQLAITGLEPGPVAERRDPSIPTTLSDRIGELPALLDRPTEEVFARLHNGSFVLESLPAAFYCFLHSPADVEEILLLAVNAGHDADTVAAMAGTLAGSLGGESALPDPMLAELEFREELRTLGRRLHGLATYGDTTALLETEWCMGGLGIANVHLTSTAVPPGDAGIEVIWDFALTFDCYALGRSLDDIGSVAKRWNEEFYRDGSLPRTLTELRLCLFFEQRRWHHFGDNPHAEAMSYITALLDAIRASVAAGRRF